MAEDGQVTPEKQLLNLIEGGGKGGASKPAGAGGGAPASGQKAAPSPLSFGNLFGALLGRVSFFKRNAKKKLSAKPKFKINLGMVNGVLALAVVALLAYLVVDAGASAMMLARPINLPRETERAASAPAASKVSPLNESAYYLQKINSRDIFKEGAKPQPKNEEKSAPAPVENNPAVSGLSLVGISWSSNPDVIIEDKDQKRTYFVKRGQALGQGVKVEAVFKDHVVLSYDGQEFELR